jgi:hypothetical protein
VPLVAQVRLITALREALEQHRLSPDRLSIMLAAVAVAVALAPVLAVRVAAVLAALQELQILVVAVAAVTPKLVPVLAALVGQVSLS